jgi:hypothetical protein
MEDINFKENSKKKFKKIYIRGVIGRILDKGRFEDIIVKNVLI